MQHLNAGLGKWAIVCWPLIVELALVPLESENINKCNFLEIPAMTPTGLDPNFNTTNLLVEFSGYKIQHLNAGLGKCWATVWPLIGELALVPLESENKNKFYFKEIPAMTYSRAYTPIASLWPRLAAALFVMCREADIQHSYI